MRGRSSGWGVLGLLLAVALLLPRLALAQGTVLQSGAVVPGHATKWVAKGVVADGGPASGGSAGQGITELMSIVPQGSGNPPWANTGTGPLGTNWCDYDGPITGPNHFLCLSPNAQGGGLIAYGAKGGASVLPLNWNVNGTNIQFPFVLTGVVGPNSSTIGDFSCWANTVGTLLNDCGSPNLYATLAGNNSFTGTTNTFGGDVVINGGGVALSITNGDLQVAGPALLQDGGTLTGIFTAPTAATGTNTTQLATTAFVNAEITANPPLLYPTNSTFSSSLTISAVNAATLVSKTLYFTGTTPNQTLTINAYSTLGVTNFSMQVCNQSTRLLKLVSADAGSQKLYPNNCNVLQTNNNVLVYQKPFQKYLVDGNTIGTLGIAVGPVGACNDNNDGLGTGTTGALCTPGKAVIIAESEIACIDQGSVFVSVEDGVYSAFTIAMAGAASTDCGDQIPIEGDIVNEANVTVTCSVICFDIEDRATSTIEGFTVVATGATMVFTRQASTVDVAGVIAQGGALVNVAEGATSNILTNGVGAPGLIVNGNTASVLNATGSGSNIVSGPTSLSVASSPITITNFVLATGLAQVLFQGLSAIGGGSVTGTKWGADLNAVIQTGTGGAQSCDSFFAVVGSINGTATRGAICF